MGICSSCLGGRDSSDEAERSRLLDSDPYGPSHHHTSYGAWSQPPIPQPHALSPEDAKREQDAMHNIMRWASDQIVEIFPVSQHRSSLQYNGVNASRNSVSNSSLSPPSSIENDREDADGRNERYHHLQQQHQQQQQQQLLQLHHQDILLSMIPGDKSKRSIRIYPASRPVSREALSVRSKASQTRLSNGSERSQKEKGKQQSGGGVFVKLNVDFP